MISTMSTSLYLRVRKLLRRLVGHLTWYPEAYDLATPDLGPAAATTLLYAAIGEYAKYIGLPPDRKPATEPTLPKDWKEMRNSAVVMALCADRKLTSQRTSEIEEGIRLLKGALRQTEELLENPRRLNHARHLKSYHFIAMAFLHVRLGDAYVRFYEACIATALGDGSQQKKYARKARAAVNKADAHFAEARDLQPGMPIIVLEQARFFGKQGKFDEAALALRGTGPIAMWTAQLDNAVTRATLASDFIAAARARNELPTVLPWLQSIKIDLDIITAEHATELTNEQKDALSWRPIVTGWLGDVLAEIGDDAGAVPAWAESAEISSGNKQLADWALTVAEKIGDKHVKFNRLAEAVDAYSSAEQKWQADKEPESSPQTSQTVKRIAAKHSLVSKMLDRDQFLDRYAEEFAEEWPEPFYIMTLGAKSPLSLQKAMVGLDRRLRAGPPTDAALRLRSAIRQLMFYSGAAAAAAVAPVLDETNEVIPVYQPIRVEVNAAVASRVQDIDALVGDSFERARERVKAEWGVRFQGVRVTDGPARGRYRILLRSKPVEEGGVSLYRSLLAPRAPIEQVFRLAGACVADNLWRVVGFTELRQLMVDNGLLTDDADAVPVEVESVASTSPLLRFVRDLLIQRIRLADFLTIYGRWQEGRAAGESPDTILEAIRRLPAIRERLWGVEPDRPLFRITKGAAARLGGAIAGSDRAARDWGVQILQTLSGSLGPNATLVLPDPSFRCPIQRLLPDVPVLVMDELSSGRLGSASVVADPGLPSTAPAVVPPSDPIVPAMERLERTIKQEAERRGLDATAVGPILLDARAAEQRGESPFYAMELALDRIGASQIDIRADASGFAVLGQWTARGRDSSLRRTLYRSTGVWVPPIDVKPGDDLEPGVWTVGFNRRVERMPQPLPANDLELEAATSAFLMRHLGAFVGNRQVEFLLFQLNQIDPVLVLNLLERYGIGTVTEILRELIDAGRSVRDLQGIAEELVLNEADMTALRGVARAELFSAVAPVIATTAGQAPPSAQAGEAGAGGATYASITTVPSSTRAG